MLMEMACNTARRREALLAAAHIREHDGPGAWMVSTNTWCTRSAMPFYSLESIFSNLLSYVYASWHMQRTIKLWHSLRVSGHARCTDGRFT